MRIFISMPISPSTVWILLSYSDVYFIVRSTMFVNIIIISACHN
nr:MAG TPA: hypothetical protein [Caudoviricetes sp.]